MKKMKTYAVVAIFLAAGSAFATKARPLAAGDYRSTEIDGQPCFPNPVANQPLCRGANGTCTIGMVTYYQDADCGIPLRFN